MILQGFTPENKERADNFMNEPNLYNTANWLTLGAVDTVKGAIRPEEPLSLQHWADSAQTALMLLPAASKGVSLLDSWRYSSGSLFKSSRINPLAIKTPPLSYPGNNPTVGPKGFEWRGSGGPLSGKGSWYNPKLDISLHADLNHGPPIGPHWDIASPNGKYRIFPDGTIKPK